MNIECTNPDLIECEKEYADKQKEKLNLEFEAM